MPPSWRDFQERENTTSSSPSSGASDSQGKTPSALLSSVEALPLIYPDNPLVIDNSGRKTGGSGTSIRATGAEPETGMAHLLSSHLREEPKTLGGLDTLVAPDPPVQPLDRPTSPDVAPPQYPDGRVGGEDDKGARAIASPPSASTPPLIPQSEAGPLILEEEEWEIRKIVSKRRAGKGYRYRVRWKDTWLPRSELGNAKRLLREFEAKSRHAHD